MFKIPGKTTESVRRRQVQNLQDIRDGPESESCAVWLEKKKTSQNFGTQAV